MSAAETTCARCGGALAGNLAFCTQCRSPLAAAPPPRMADRTSPTGRRDIR
ncbi:MAG: hypothetical protein Q7J48_00905 [Nocardioides sp.]|nr:hypothetical protein [Nocardioides sp.]